MSATDNFNRADGALGANWTSPCQAGNASGTVISNQYGGSGGNDQYDGLWVVQFAADCAVEIDVVSALTGDQEIDPILRASNINSGSETAYIMVVTSNGTNNVRMFRQNSGAYTEISSGDRATQNFAAGDGIRFRATGSSLSAWVRVSGTWTNFKTWTDSSITAGGYAGFSTYRAAVRADNFYVDSDFPPVPTPERARRWMGLRI